MRSKRGKSPDKRVGAVQVVRVVFRVSDLPCAAAAATLAKRVRALPGVADVTVNPVTERVVLMFDPWATSALEIMRAIEARGYAVERPPAPWYATIPGAR